MADATAPPAPSDTTPAAIVIGYRPPLPLIRIPVQGEGGAWGLAFRSSADKDAALAACTAEVTANCEAGARHGCVLAAAATCAAHRRGFWNVVLGRVTGRGARLDDERAACEARETEVYLADAAARCAAHASDFCARAVGGTPVADRVERRFKRRPGGRARWMLLW